MEEFAVRDATRDDCGDIIRFITELAVFEKELETRVKVTKETLIRDGFLAEKPLFRCVVGEIKTPDGPCSKKAKVIGFGLFFPTYSTWDGATMKLEDLYIQPDYRRKGYGMRLIARVTEIALSENCVRLHWNVLDWNQPAIELYSKIGADIQAQWNVCILHEPEMKKLKDRIPEF
jgi:Acetyltransferases